MSQERNASGHEGIATKSPKPSSAVIALSTWEIEAFFPGDSARQLQSLFAKSQQMDPTQINADQWPLLLQDSQCEVIVTGWKTRLIPVNLDRLRYICHLTGSVRWLVPRELLARGVRVTNWGPCAAPTVAEHALLLILTSLRSLQQWGQVMDARYLPEATSVIGVRSLYGRRVGIHGFGGVARELVSLLQPFNCDIAAYSQGVPRQLMLDHGVRPCESLESLAADVDVLVTCEALTNLTRHSINRSVLLTLPRGSVFVNVGRGSVVDEQALGEVAKERELRVASDVFEHEPLPRTSPLYEIPHAIYSPHIAGPTPDQLPKCGSVALDNLQRFINHEPLRYEVTTEIFDRST